MLSQAATPNTMAATPMAAAMKRQDFQSPVFQCPVFQCPAFQSPGLIGRQLRPNRREGRHASVARSTPKATAGDHDAPIKIVDRFSTSPNEIAATTVPR